ncbi:MAG: hypothetical protein FWC17_02980 [Treponema sp.]|nr:hypothetical protein [Treponema sp.]
MRLSAPKNIVFIISIILIIVGVIAYLAFGGSGGFLYTLHKIAIWIVTGGGVLLSLGVLLKGF